MDWAPQLLAAQGDDKALLSLAQRATALDIKLAAVQALASETALKQAEREFRSHDRKVHRLAKQRLEAAVEQRQSRATAQLLLARTQALLDEPQLAVNQVVELDRDWQALPTHALEATQAAAFSELRARLNVQMLARADAEQELKRWTAAAKQLLKVWPQRLLLAAQAEASVDATAVAAAGALVDATADATAQAPTQAPSLAAALQTLISARPTHDTAAEPAAAQSQALLTTQAVQAHLELLASTPAATADLPIEISTDLKLDPALSAVLSQRHQQWLQTHRPKPLPTAPAPPATRAPKPPKAVALDDEQLQKLNGLLQKAETAQAEGQLGDMRRQLQAIESFLARAHATLPEALRERHQALWSEQGRLHEWQQWGGARARDDLADEAELLARQTQPVLLSPASSPDVPPTPQPAAPDATDAPVGELAAPEQAVAPAPAVADGPGPITLPAPKLNLKDHNDSIRALRQRWKELDRQGAEATPQQWQRFDAALQVAYEPVAAQQAVLKLARQQNQAERETLLAALESLPLPGDADTTPAQPHDWRDSSRELDRFQTAWRKLGPLEHTAPHAAQAQLTQRLRSALARIETPLQAARTAAAAQRDQLIARAEQLSPAAGETDDRGDRADRGDRRETRDARETRSAPDAARQVRELQAQWQDQARQLPLPRGLENALWARFKSATDAVFAQRDAAFAARDTELAANLAHAESLIAQLQAITTDTPLPELERTLAEVDRAWRQGGELPHGAGPKLEPRYRQAREQATQQIGLGQRQRWLALCHTLTAKLALCQAQEAGAPSNSAELSPRWAEQSSLPEPWEQILAQRWSTNAAAAAAATSPTATAAAALNPAARNELLLRLEVALGLPCAPQWQAARQTLKLKALKDAMEGRSAAVDSPALHGSWLQTLLKQTQLDAEQEQRLQDLLSALAKAPAGTLGLVLGHR